MDDDCKEIKKCPCCHADAENIRFLCRCGTDEKYAQYECGACGFQFTFPPPSAEELNQFYSAQNYYGDGDASVGDYSNYDEQVAQTLLFFSGWMKKLKVAPGTRVLDVGCAKGRFLEVADKEFGCQCFGVELSDWARTFVETNYSGRYRVWKRVEDIPADVGPFDYIFLFDVIEHVNTPWDLLLPLFQCGCIGPETKLLITTPNCGSRPALDDPSTWQYRYPPAHLSFCSPRTFQKIADMLLAEKAIISGHSVNSAWFLSGPAESSFDWYDGLYCEIGNFITASIPGKDFPGTIDALLSSPAYPEMLVRFFRTRVSEPFNAAMPADVQADIRSLESRLKETQEMLSSQQRQRAGLEAELNTVYHSRSWRIGRACTAWFRWAAKARSIQKNNGTAFLLKRIFRKLFLREKVRYYSVISSIGANCEISFNMNRVFGFVDSYPLTWAFVHDIGKLPGVIRDPEALLQETRIVHDHSCNMCRYEESDISFHCKGHAESLLDESGKVDETKAAQERAELKERLTYLCGKWKKLLSDPERSLLSVLSPWENTSTDDILAVHEALKEYPKDDLLVVMTGQEKNISPEKLRAAGIFVRFISHHPPHDAVTDVAQNDINGWNRIFDEFRPSVIKESHKTYKYEH